MYSMYSTLITAPLEYDTIENGIRLALQVKHLLLAGFGFRGWGREVLELVWSLPCLAVADLLPWRKGLEVAIEI
jgi:hypothetical protein